MPPHCDSMDGPVVTAARQALEAEDVRLILPYVPQDGEAEVIQTYDKVVRVRKDGALVRDVADMYFFETVVRVHRAGEGAPYTGLKPAGLSEGPVIPVAEKAIETGDPNELLDTLATLIRAAIKQKFERVMYLKQHADASVDAAREYVEAMLGLQVYAHKLYLAIQSEPHAGHHNHG